MNICMVGTGYVGLVTGTCFAEFGNHVACIDNDLDKIDRLNKGIIPIYEPGLDVMVARNVKENRLSFGSDLHKAVQQSLVVFIAVGTPPKKDGSADLSYVQEAAKQIGQSMNGFKVIVNKSTVPVGSVRWIAGIIKENAPQGANFAVVSNPEFLREGSAIEDFMRPDRVVIGSDSPEAIAIMKDLYDPLYLIETPFVITNPESSELIKYASNAFLATKISFINEIANLCDKVGADVHHVAKGMGLDRRIGPKFLHPGPGFGGSCFPKDTSALAQIGQQYQSPISIVEQVIKVNQQQKESMVRRITEAVGKVKGKTVGILGISFKPNTDDLRDAPALLIIKALQDEGAKIKAFDPAGMENARKTLDEVIFCQDEYQVAEGSDAVVIVTEWNQFRSLDLERIKTSMHQPILIDLRNIYEPAKMKQLGFSYTCIGRPYRAK
jgi:UDPglucose 6-dehydrogenase